MEANHIEWHHHHHIALVAQISLTLSRHSSLSFIALGRSSGQHPVSSHSCWMYVCAGRPAFARPCVGVHKSTSLMSSSLLLQQCPACLVCLTWIVFVMVGRWPYSWCLVGCCRQDLFKIARSILNDIIFTIKGHSAFKNWNRLTITKKRDVLEMAIHWSLSSGAQMSMESHIHYYYSQVHSDPVRQKLLGPTSIGQSDLFKKYS